MINVVDFSKVATDEFRPKLHEKKIRNYFVSLQKDEEKISEAANFFFSSYCEALFKEENFNFANDVPPYKGYVQDFKELLGMLIDHGASVNTIMKNKNSVFSNAIFSGWLVFADFFFKEKDFKFPEDVFNYNLKLEETCNIHGLISLIDGKTKDIEKVKELIIKGVNGVDDFCFPHYYIVDVFVLLNKNFPSENWMDLKVEKFPSILHFLFKVAKETDKVERDSYQFNLVSEKTKEFYLKNPFISHEIKHEGCYLNDAFGFLKDLREKNELLKTAENKFENKKNEDVKFRF